MESRRKQAESDPAGLTDMHSDTVAAGTGPAKVQARHGPSTDGEVNMVFYPYLYLYN